MKFDINSFGKNMFNITMGTVKQKIKDISISRHNNGLKLIKDDRTIYTDELDLYQPSDTRKLVTSHPGTVNINPSFVLDNSDLSNYIEPTFNGENSYGRYSISAGSKTILGNYLFPINKQYEYRFVIDIKASINGEADPENKKILFYAGYAQTDGDISNTSSISKITMGNIIYPQCLIFYGSDGWYSDDPNTAYKYTLSRKFSKGDDYIYFTTPDINNWTIRTYSNGAILKYEQAFKLHRKMKDGTYCYVSKNGKIHNHLGYSADICYYNLYEQDTSKEVSDPLRYFVPTGNTINGETEYKAHLNSYNWWLWKGKYDYYPAGSIFIQTRGGGTYTYLISAKKIEIDNEYKHIVSPWIDLSDYNGISNYYYYRDGGVLGRLMMLMPYYLYDADNKAMHYITADDKITVDISNMRIEYRLKD